MKNNTDLDARFEAVFKPLFDAGKVHSAVAEKLCKKIDKSNGQISRAFRGMVCSGMSAVEVSDDRH